MSLDKIDFIYRGGDYHVFKENHYKLFAKALLKQVKHHKDFLITYEWKNIRENSLIVAYDYEGFYDDIVHVAKHQQNAHEFYRRIFIINWRHGFADDPRDYQQKSFAGNLLPYAYDQ